MKKAVTVLFSVFISSAFAGTNIESTVMNTGINSKGSVFVTFKDDLIQPGCTGKKQLVLPPESKIKNKILSVALAAKASGAKVEVQPAGCYMNQPSLLEDVEWGWLLIK